MKLLKNALCEYRYGNGSRRKLKILDREYIPNTDFKVLDLSVLDRPNTITLQEWQLYKMLDTEASNLLDILVVDVHFSNDYVPVDVPIYAKLLEKYQINEIMLNLNATEKVGGDTKRLRKAVLQAFIKEGFTEKEKVCLNRRCFRRRALSRSRRDVVLMNSRKACPQIARCRLMGYNGWTL
jgi:hypothetical protein